MFQGPRQKAFMNPIPKLSTVHDLKIRPENPTTTKTRAAMAQIRKVREA